MYKKLLALSTFSGTIIGVGLFGLPYVASQIGFLPMVIYFLALGLVLTIIHLMYGEITLRTASNHRLPGYSKLYLGSKASLISYLSAFVGLTGALLVYVVIGGEFSYNLFAPIFGGTQFLYSTIFFALGALIISRGSGPVSKAEFFSLGMFFVILILMFAKALPNINLDYLNTFNISEFLLPYGVIIFSLGGMAIIPELKEILKNQEKSLKKIIIIGLIIPIVTYLFFIFTVLGVTGINTSPEAIVGLNNVLGGGIASLGFVFGIITTFTSFLTLGITLKKTLHCDKGLPSWLSWVIACFPAYLLFLFNLKNFIGIIGFLGAVTLGIDTILIILIYNKAKIKSQKTPEYSLNLKHSLIFALSIIFISGIILEVLKIFI